MPSSFDLLLFDLDGTLYDHACGYEDEIHANIFRFMVESTGGKFGAIDSLATAQQVWQPIFTKYNLTKRGLLAEGYLFDGRQYDQYIRQGANKFIRKDPELRDVLLSLPQRKVIFTNAPESSANEILDLLGVADLFEAVLGADLFLHNEICKPERAAFDKLLDYVQVPPEKICYFEDSFQNLIAGKELGMATVFVTSETLNNEGRSVKELEKFDAVIHRQVNKSLREIMPQLWDE